MYSGRLKRRMWFETAQRLRYTLTRFHGDRFDVEPRAEVLVPLPHVAVEGHLAVDLELVHVDRLAEDLDDRLDHPRMAREPRERRAVHVRGEVRPHGVAALLADVLGAVLGIDPWHLVGQDLDLRGRELAGGRKKPRPRRLPEPGRPHHLTPPPPPFIAR